MNFRTLTLLGALIAAAAITFLSFVTRAQAQSANGALTYQGPTTVLSGGTNWIAVFVTNTYNSRVDLPRADSVALYVSAKPLLSNDVNLTLTFNRSIDGGAGTFDDITPLVLIVTGTTNVNTTNVVSLVTNIPVGAIPYFKLTSVGNRELVATVTNLTVKYGFKR
jgi:hypothetical protein